MPLEEIYEEQIHAFRDALAATSAPATVNNALKTVRRIFRSARIDGYLLRIPQRESRPSRITAFWNAARSR